MNRRKFFPTLAALALLCAAQGPSAAQGPAAPSDGVGRVSVDDLRALLASGRPVLGLDVRGGATEGIKGAVNIPLDQVEARASEIPQDREVVTYCA